MCFLSSDTFTSVFTHNQGFKEILYLAYHRADWA